MIALLSGGTGGAKLASGFADVLAPGELAVVANTGDDIAAFGLHVSPDPDLITYWLAGVIDEQRGYGIRDETHNAFDQLRRLGAPDWFRLGDSDLATCLLRTQLLHEGHRLTEIARHLASAFDLDSYVLPMCDEPVQTYVRSAGEWRHFQEYLILQHASPEIEGVEFRGIDEAGITEEAHRAIELAELIVIGPSNPVASIGPILATPGMREALDGADAPIVAISPLIEGRSLKGPTENFMRRAGLELSDAGIAAHYGDLIDGLVVHGSPAGPAMTLGSTVTRQTDTLMPDAAARSRLASETLDFVKSLSG